jgi:hypothetical protein
MLGSAPGSQLSEITKPEFPSEFENHQNRCDQHQPITDGMGFAEIMERKPIDNQKQKTCRNHEYVIYFQHILFILNRKMNVIADPDSVLIWWATCFRRHPIENHQTRNDIGEDTIKRVTHRM